METLNDKFPLAAQYFLSKKCRDKRFLNNRYWLLNLKEVLSKKFLEK